MHGSHTPAERRMRGFASKFWRVRELGLVSEIPRKHKDVLPPERGAKSEILASYSSRAKDTANPKAIRSELPDGICRSFDGYRRHGQVVLVGRVCPLNHSGLQRVFMHAARGLIFFLENCRETKSSQDGDGLDRCLCLCLLAAAGGDKEFTTHSIHICAGGYLPAECPYPVLNCRAKTPTHTKVGQAQTRTTPVPCRTEQAGSRAFD